MKTKYPALMFWWTMYWLSVAILEWVVVDQVSIASRESSFGIFW
jgi:hypothetical protein